MTEDSQFPAPRVTDSSATIDLQGTEKYTGADVIVDHLAVIGAEYVFGVQGGAIEPLFDAIARRRRKGGFRLAVKEHQDQPQARNRDTLYFGPQPIFTRHETGAAFMADGYYRETGRLGVCCSTTGPGATNLLTGVASAYAENIPLLVITPQTAMDKLGRGSLQESGSESVDTVGMFAHCTRYNSFVSHPEQLGQKLSAAILRAFQHPMGPVHLSIPREILAAATGENQIVDIGPKLREKKIFDEVAAHALAKDLAALSEAGENIVCVVGQDCSGAMPQIESLVERLGGAFVSTAPGKQHVNAFHHLYKGVFGYAGHESARSALLSAKRILLIGSPLSEITSGGWDSALDVGDLIHISVNGEHFLQTSKARLHVEGHLESVMKFLLKELGQRSSSKPMYVSSTAANSISESPNGLAPQIQHEAGVSPALYDAPIKPAALMVSLSESLPANTRYMIEAGNSWAWALHYLHTSAAGSVRVAMGFASMCWAIGAAIGTKLGNKSLPVVCIAGDGAWLMSSQEVTVAVQMKLPVVYVILNDSAYGMVRHGQLSGSAEQVGWELPTIDYAAMANAVGARGVRVRDYSDLEALDYTAYLNSDRPTVIDIEIDADSEPPMSERLRVLHGES